MRQRRERAGLDVRRLRDHGGPEGGNPLAEARRLAVETDGGEVAERAALGSELLAAGRQEEALPILEECVARAPGNAGFSSLLGRCCHACAVSRGQPVEDGFVLTRSDQVESARRFAVRIRALAANAADLEEVAADLEDWIARATVKRFDGSVLLILAGLLVGGLSTALESSLSASYMFVVSALYGLTSIRFQYQLNEADVAGKGRVTFRDRLRALRDPTGRRTMLRGTLDRLRFGWFGRDGRRYGRPRRRRRAGGCMVGLVAKALAVLVAIAILASILLVATLASVLLVAILLSILTVRNLIGNRAATAEILRGLLAWSRRLFAWSRRLIRRGGASA